MVMSDMRIFAPPDFNIDLEIVPRGCRLDGYNPVPVPTYRIRDEFITYTSPDSTYAVTRDLLKAARKSILIGIYDFTADYVRDLLVAAVKRGVKVSLMLDMDNLKGETEIFNQLIKAGVKGVPAPSCASHYAQYFRSSHEKVIVIDDEWTLVQSGNYTFASIPRNEVDGGDRNNFEKGNRDMGAAIHNPELAAFFTQILRADMQLETDAEGTESFELEGAPVEEISMEAPRPPSLPPQLFPSQRFKPGRRVRVVPVLSPDNYMQVIPPFLESARKSILIEQQYIKATQPHIQMLLTAITAAWERNPALDVRIILAVPIGDKEKEKKNLQELEKYGLKLGVHIRYLNKKFFAHCHNKLIVVDGKAVLVSSQNWSDSAVAENREAGLLIYNAPMTRYFAGIFQMDWETGMQSLSASAAAGEEEAFDMGGAAEAYVSVAVGDYMEV
jgi:phosphatidylserine/phosphatidylglycerophosphate/cardiolipin synthase-like enzyme